MPARTEVKFYTTDVAKKVGEVAKARLLNMVRFVERTVQESFREAKTGAIYGTHQASAAGEAPAIRTGRYRQSIHHEIRQVGPASFEADLGSTVEGQGDWLEFGTKDRRELNPSAETPTSLEFGTSGMSPRPHWRPALEKLRKRIAEFLKPEA